MRGFVDTSVLIKSYVHENRSELAIDLLDELAIPVPVSPLLRLEFMNALQLKQFRGELTPEEVSVFMDAFQSDLQNGICRLERMDLASIYARALEISITWTSGVGARSLDILHVATALEMKLETLITFDHRQAELARSAGLNVLGL